MLRNTLRCLKQPKLTSRNSQILTYATHNQSTEGDRTLLSQYTDEESAKILKLMNTLNLPDYESYNLSKRRAGKLLEWKNRNGPFQNLNDILLVDGFGPKVAENFYQSLLEDPMNKGENKARLRTTSFLTPPFDAEQRLQIRSSVSLRVGVSSVTWARLEVPPAEHNSPCLLTHWQHNEISGKKLHLQDLVERCLYMDHQIPEADCYLFENPQMATVNRNPGTAEQQNISIQKSQITAALSFALNRRNFGQTNETTRRANVFYLRRFLTARLFNHLVGTERVSSEETILKMMRTHYNANDAKTNFVYEDYFDDIVEDNDAADSLSTSDLRVRGEVLFSSELRQMFALAERYPREFLGQCLLLNLAFVRLALLQDPKSIALISRKSNRDVNKEDV